MPTTAAIIIGDEILSAKFADENGPFVIRRMRELGADLGRLVVIGDELEDISAEVARCSATFDHVLTTGGVGPTHDDRTLAGVAHAFERPLVRNDELVALLASFGLPMNDATLQMAHVPEGAELVAGDERSIPVIRTANVWSFPGVPGLFRRKFDTVASHFTGPRLFEMRLGTALAEAEIAAALAEAHDAEPDVSIGSYPRFADPTGIRVLVTLESRDNAALERTEERLRAALPWLDGPSKP